MSATDTGRQTAPGGSSPQRPAPGRTPSRRGRWVLLAVLVLAVLLVAWIVFAARSGGGGAAHGGRGGRGGAGQVTSVNALKTGTGDIPVYLNALGTVTPPATVTVRTQIAGQLLSVSFREGQDVTKGQLLAQVDPRPYQAALAQAQGALTRDQAQLANARIDLERYITLLSQDSIARQTVDTQRATVRQLEGTVAVDRGAVESARVNLGYTRITAPVSGRLGLRQVDPGNYVSNGDTNGLVTITTITPIDAVFTIPEDQVETVLARMRTGARLGATAFDRANTQALEDGYLLTLDNQIDTTTGTVKAKARFANADGKLFPNQFVNVRLLVDTLHDSVLAPTSAILRGQNGLFVWVVDPDRTVRQQAVTTGPAVGEVTAITSGLQPGETLVTDGSDRLRDGGEVLLPGDCPPPEEAGGKGGSKRGKGGGHRGSGARGGQAAATGAGANGASCTATPISRGEGGPTGAGAQKRQQAMLDQLGLDPARKAKVEAIYASDMPKMRAAFQSGDFQAAMAARQAMTQKIDAVLTPEQQAKFHQLQQQMRGGRGGGGHGGAGAQRPGGGGGRGAPINVPVVQAPALQSAANAPAPSAAQDARGGAPASSLPPSAAAVASSTAGGSLAGPAPAASATTAPRAGPAIRPSQPATPSAAPTGAGGGRGGGMQAMMSQLNLDPVQRQKIETITAALRPRMQAAFQSGDMAAAMAARQQMGAQIEAVLRPDQKAKYQQLRAQMRGRFQQQGGGGAPGGAR